jgi:hypothetical protein
MEQALTMSSFPTAATKPAAKVAGQDSTSLPEIVALRRGMAALARQCTEAVGKAVQHFQGDDAWVIGPMPACAEMAETLEAQARSFLANSSLSMTQIDEIATLLKAMGDLRAVARSARQVSQLAWLFRHEAGAYEITTRVRRVGEAALDVALLVAQAMEKGDPHMARQAALMYRQVDEARTEAERFFRSDVAQYTYSPMVLRMGLAGVWFMTISGEGMARIAARNAAV